MRTEWQGPRGRIFECLLVLFNVVNVYAYLLVLTRDSHMYRADVGRELLEAAGFGA